MNIVNTMLWMQKNAYEESTIRKVGKLLRHLKRNCNTNEPEEVKLYVSRKRCGNGHKENLIEAYACFMRSINREWNQPFYARYDKKRRAPKEELLNFMINHFRLELATKLSMSKDLGTRPIELTWLTVKDIDLTTGNVSITGAKHTVGREGKLKQKTLDLLKTYITKKHLTANSTLFPLKSENLANDYRHYRNRLADDYNMPELRQIQLYDFRRWKGTRTYKLTRSILHTQQVLGHSQNDVRATLKYITLEDDLGSWIPVKAVTDEEKAECIANDYPLVANDNGIFWFKRPA